MMGDLVMKWRLGERENGRNKSVLICEISGEKEIKNLNNLSRLGGRVTQRRRRVPQRIS
jgi:hypothetical protein